MLKVYSVETNYKFRRKKTKKISLQQSTCIANNHIIQSAQDRKEATYTKQATPLCYTWTKQHITTCAHDITMSQ